MKTKYDGLKFEIAEEEEEKPLTKRELGAIKRMHARMKMQIQRVLRRRKANKVAAKHRRLQKERRRG